MRIVITILIISCMVLLTAPGYAASKSIGTITRIQAGAEINGTPVNNNAPVHAGDIITTNETGRVSVTFKDDSLLTVGGSSEFIIDSFAYSDDDSAKEALLRLTKGAFRIITSTVVDTDPENFKVITPLATIGIRGTDFWGGFLTADELDVIMLKGKGVIVTTEGGTATIDTPGFGLTVPDPTKAPLPPKQWGHTKVSRATATVTFE